MIEMDEAVATAALRDLALEDEAGIDRALDATAQRAPGRSLLEVEQILRSQLHRQHFDLGGDIGRIAEQIVRAVNAPAGRAAGTTQPSGGLAVV